MGGLFNPFIRRTVADVDPQVLCLMFSIHPSLSYSQRFRLHFLITSQSLVLFSFSYILTTFDDPSSFFLHLWNRAHIIVTNCFYIPKVCITEFLTSSTYIYNMHISQWVTVPRATQCYRRVQMNTNSLVRELSGPRPSRRVVDRANLGCWHSSTTDIHIPSLRDSHPMPC